MQRSSNKVGALAAALAKAQAEIVNPEKSLTATIPSPFPKEGSRTFRYAPLSVGLEIIRKCLGQHEIAAVQATAFDRESGLIKLTTTLVHSSGEWMSSDWPVCPVSETAAPHRMGAALTYARRYALFTLVGIAGEDDLDAPDLIVDPGPGGGPRANMLIAGRPNGAPANGEGRARRDANSSPKATLVPSASVEVRDRMLAEIAKLASDDDVDRWAFRSLPDKNLLLQRDAQLVEAAFSAKLGETNSFALVSPPVIDKSELAFPEPRRARDKTHLRFVAKQPCIVCGRQPCDPHHLRFAQPRGLGLKVSDEFTVPLCRVHHRELHRAGKEFEWWSKTGIEPLTIARELWLTTHPMLGQDSNLPDADASGTSQSVDGPAALLCHRPMHPSFETKPI
jgi:hypothetical protein